MGIGKIKHSLLSYTHTIIQSFEECNMKIDEGKCIGCERCIVYCPVAAISMYPSMNRYGKVARIDFDECVECCECQKSGVCPVDAHYQQKLEGPRTLRELWSNPLGV